MYSYVSLIYIASIHVTEKNGRMNEEFLDNSTLEHFPFPLAYLYIFIFNLVYEGLTKFVFISLYGDNGYYAIRMSKLKHF